MIAHDRDRSCRRRDAELMSDRALRFYFDYISPNAYLVWTRLPALEERHGVHVVPVPVLFAGLLEAYGQLGPAEVPPKVRWMTRNNLRKAAILGVPLEPPAFHPFNPLLALRVSSVAIDDGAKRRLVSVLFEAVWVRGLHVAEAAVVERVVREAGLDAGALLEAASTPECKALLRAQTDAAIARGVFGVPTMEVGDELFWGYDDMPYLERYLAGNDPLDPTRLTRWSTPRASATRSKAPAKPGA
jgi:2-hydroxychromene-2-carboxylate isomerase